LFVVEVMPPDTNRGPTVDGGWVRLGGRKPAEASCRDEVAAVLAALRDRTGQLVFTVREVYAEMLSTGTRYAESTVFKTMQRMKEPPGRAPWIVLEQTGAGFRVSTRDGAPVQRPVARSRWVPAPSSRLRSPTVP
jgi:hypothetical protein